MTTRKTPSQSSSASQKQPLVQKVTLVNGHRRNGAIGATATVPENETGPWLEKGWKHSGGTSSRNG